MQSLANGTELGAFTIVRLIGRGGMGEVYEAYEHRLQRRVALKVIAPQKAGVHGEVDLVRRFLQEARTLAQINHSNVVTIYSIERISDTQFIAMEFVDGAAFKDLFALFALSADEAAPIFLQLLEGLKCLHENRILHRDIKPHNLMIRPNGQVKILDFGIAKRLGDRNRQNTTVGVVVGTLAYLPPEVLHGMPATERSDLWSLGAIFYECIVGQPLVALHSMKVHGVRAASESDVVFPQECLGWIAPEMRSIIAKLCARHPEQRYASAAEAIEAIKRFQSQRPPLPPAGTQAFLKALEGIEEVKASVNLDELNSPKSKRAHTLKLLGGHEEIMPLAFVAVEEPLGPAVTELIRDSISARRRTKGRARRGFWAHLPLPVVLATLVGVGAIWKMLVSHPGHEAVPKKTLEPSMTEEVLHLSAPSENQALWLEPTQIPSFSWSKTVANGDLELQIASDVNFNSIVVREPVGGASYRPGQLLPEGHYYWQLWPRRAGIKAIGPSHFTISFSTPLSLLWPKAEQVFEMSRAKRNQMVGFKWRCKPGVQVYNAQVSSDAEFVRVVAEKSTSRCEWNDVRLTAGNYHWRVRADQPSQMQALSTAKQAFMIKAAGSPLPLPLAPSPTTTPVTVNRSLNPPLLKNTKQVFTMEFKAGANIRDVASARKHLLAVPEFRWQPVRGARSYLVQISPVFDFSRLYSEETVTTPRLEWAQAVPGKVFWRVKAQNESGASVFSVAGSAQVKVPAPNMASVYKLTGTRIVDWAPVPFADKYLVRWGADRSLASANEKVTSEPQVLFEVNESPAFLQVAAANFSGERVSGFSSVAAVNVERALKLAAPGLVTPPRGAKVVVGKSGRISVVFSWSKVDGAQSYDVELSDQADFSGVMQQKTVKSTHWLLKGAKLNGKIYWRVRSEGAAGTSAWSTLSLFEVR